MTMTDYERQEFEEKIHSLEQRFNQFALSTVSALRRLEAEIYKKADRDHSHKES